MPIHIQRPSVTLAYSSATLQFETPISQHGGYAYLWTPTSRAAPAKVGLWQILL
jgi:hypothetical protein